MAFVSLLYDIERQRTIFGNMTHEAQQIPTPVVSQELTSTPDDTDTKPHCIVHAAFLKSKKTMLGYGF